MILRCLILTVAGGMLAAGVFAQTLKPAVTPRYVPGQAGKPALANPTPAKSLADLTVPFVSLQRITKDANCGLL